MTAYRDYEFDRRVNDVRRLQSALTHFDRAVTQGMVAMKEVASAFEAVGQAFTELTLTNNNPVPEAGDVEELNAYPTEADVQYMSQQAATSRSHSASESLRNVGAAAVEYAGSVASTRMPDEANSQVRRLAKLFAEEARRINEGPPFQSYNAGIHRDVVTRLLPVSEHLKCIGEYRHKRTEALERYNKYKAEVEKVERRYTRKGKPFCDSKSHRKYTQKRDEAWREYTKRRDKFNNTFSLLMEVNDHAAAQIIHRYLSLNHEYLQQLVTSMDRVLPAMAEVYPLNTEYNSLQNTLILEAVANAKAPFADHSKMRSGQTVPGHGDPEDGGEHEDDDEAVDADDDAQQDSLTPISSDDPKNAGSNSRLEEPVDYETLLETSAALEPAEMPHEPARADAHPAAETGEDHEHAATQPQRLGV
ncbi:hypothetical protein LSCM1_07209 [Leishmania martiniquensis]|uniref:BAR domain-containing protein n=1 Tax=Leishmania martiniquensis TaxID=1580590 RepID=A0A836KSZ6_9TRYP|nr:hypothetical protein LSCM1_07209 [Leishmania martiniquensis]